MTKTGPFILVVLIACSLLVFALVTMFTPVTPRTVTHLHGETAPGRIYTANAQIYNYLEHRLLPGQRTLPHALMFDKDGILLESLRVGLPYVMNFGPRPEGGYLYAQAMENTEDMEGKNPAGEHWVFLDEKFEEIDQLTAQNLVHTDGHEILWLRNGNYLLMSYDLKPETGLISCVLQEINKAREVVWEWDSIDHIKPAESYDELVTTDGDYVHANSAFEDRDGNLIVSMRNTSQVIKINKATGNIAWRLGGKQNDFTFISDSFDGFSAQHHAQILDNGNLILYDNGNQHNPPQTRIVEYALNETNKTAILVWSYSLEGKFTPATGSVQRLPNGNTFIGWGSPSDHDTLRISEIDPNGKTLLEIHFPPEEILYRAYKR